MAKISAILKKDKKDEKGYCPIYLRVHKNGKYKYFSLNNKNAKATENTWDKENELLIPDKRKNPNHKEINLLISSKLKELTDIIEDFERKGIDWSFILLEKKFVFKPKGITFDCFLEQRIQTLHTVKNYNNIYALQTLRRVVIEFMGSEKKYLKMQFSDFDLNWVERFVKWGQTEKEWKNTSTATHLKHISATLNAAINDDCGCRETYPFSNAYGALKYYKIKNLKSNIKRQGLPREYVKKLINAKFYNWNHMVFWKMFLFQRSLSKHLDWYILCKIKHSNIQVTLNATGNPTKQIKYRKECNDTKNNTVFYKTYTVNLTEEGEEIIKWFEQNKPGKNGFIFPVLGEKDKNYNRKIKQHKSLKDNFLRHYIINQKLNRSEIIPGSLIWDECMNKEFWQEHLVLAQKLFLFSFYNQGLNHKDIAALTNKNIIDIYDEEEGENKAIQLNRSKTGAAINIPLSKESQELLSFFANNYELIEGYLTPIVKEKNLNDLKTYKAVTNNRAALNRSLKIIAKELDFPAAFSNLFFYHARHTYTNLARQAGASYEMIAQAVGHQDHETTKTYLNDFNIGVMREMNQNVIDYVTKEVI